MRRPKSSVCSVSVLACVYFCLPQPPQLPFPTLPLSCTSFMCVCAPLNHLPLPPSRPSSSYLPASPTLSPPFSLLPPLLSPPLFPLSQPMEDSVDTRPFQATDHTGQCTEGLVLLGGTRWEAAILFSRQRSVNAVNLKWKFLRH